EDIFESAVDLCADPRGPAVVAMVDGAVAGELVGNASVARVADFGWPDAGLLRAWCAGDGVPEDLFHVRREQCGVAGQRLSFALRGFTGLFERQGARIVCGDVRRFGLRLPVEITCRLPERQHWLNPAS